MFHKYTKKLVEEEIYYLRLRKLKVQDFDFTALETIGRYEFKGDKTVVIHSAADGLKIKEILINEVGMNPVDFGLTNSRYAGHSI